MCFLFAKQLHFYLFNGVEVVEYANDFGDRIKLLTIASKFFNIISHPAFRNYLSFVSYFNSYFRHSLNCAFLL